MRERGYDNNDSQRRGKKERRGGKSRERKYGLQCLPGGGEEERPGMPTCRKKHIRHLSYGFQCVIILKQ